MNIAGLCLGIVSIAMMLIGLFPCFGGLNWLVIPLAIIGIVISLVGLILSDQMSRSSAIAGLVLNIIAMVIGIIRLILGLGVF